MPQTARHSAQTAGRRTQEARARAWVGGNGRPRSRVAVGGQGQRISGELAALVGAVVAVCAREAAVCCAAGAAQAVAGLSIISPVRLMAWVSLQLA